MTSRSGSEVFFLFLQGHAPFTLGKGPWLCCGTLEQLSGGGGGMEPGLPANTPDKLPSHRSGQNLWSQSNLQMIKDPGTIWL